MSHYPLAPSEGSPSSLSESKEVLDAEIRDELTGLIARIDERVRFCCVRGTTSTILTPTLPKPPLDDFLVAKSRYNDLVRRLPCRRPIPLRAFDPLLHLNADILLELFDLVIDQDMATPMLLSSVSTSWQTWFTHQPSLWRNIRIDPGKLEPSNLEIIQMCCRLARQSPLDLVVQLAAERPPVLQTLTLTQPIHSLTMRSSVAVSPVISERSLLIAIGGSTIRVESPIQFERIDIDAPCLLRHQNFSDYGLQHLRSLRLRCFRETLPSSPLRMPHLLFLSLNFQYPVHHTPLVFTNLECPDLKFFQGVLQETTSEWAFQWVYHWALSHQKLLSVALTRSITYVDAYLPGGPENIDSKHGTNSQRPPSSIINYNVRTSVLHLWTYQISQVHLLPPLLKMIPHVASLTVYLPQLDAMMARNTLLALSNNPSMTFLHLHHIWATPPTPSEAPSEQTPVVELPALRTLVLNGSRTKFMRPILQQVLAPGLIELHLLDSHFSEEPDHDWDLSMDLTRILRSAHKIEQLRTPCSVNQNIMVLTLHEIQLPANSLSSFLIHASMPTLRKISLEASLPDAQHVQSLETPVASVTCLRFLRVGRPPLDDSTAFHDPAVFLRLFPNLEVLILPWRPLSERTALDVLVDFWDSGQTNCGHRLQHITSPEFPDDWPRLYRSLRRRWLSSLIDTTADGIQAPLPILSISFPTPPSSSIVQQLAASLQGLYAEDNVWQPSPMWPPRPFDPEEMVWKEVTACHYCFRAGLVDGCLLSVPAFRVEHVDRTYCGRRAPDGDVDVNGTLTPNVWTSR